MVHNVLTIHGISCEMMCSGTVGRYRLSVSEKVHIPAMTEMIIDGRVENSQIHPKGLCIIEPKDPSEKSRPETWPGKHMGKATPVWQLTLSHRCHQM